MFERLRELDRKVRGDVLRERSRGFKNKITAWHSLLKNGFCEYCRGTLITKPAGCSIPCRLRCSLQVYGKGSTFLAVKYNAGR